MLIVSGTMEVPAGREEEMKAACAEMALATRAEDGCRAYAFWQNVEVPTQFRVYEEWRDKDCLKAHSQTAHMAAYREKLAAIGVSGRDISLFEPGQMTKL